MDDVRYWESELRVRNRVAKIADENVRNAQIALRRLIADQRAAAAKVAEAKQQLNNARNAKHRQ